MLHKENDVELTLQKLSILWLPLTIWWTALKIFVLLR